MPEDIQKITVRPNGPYLVRGSIPLVRKSEVMSEHGESVRLVGPIYDPAKLNGLYANAYAYLHGHEVGGTNPALLRAMDSGRASLALDVVFNREVLGDTGVFFSHTPGDLASKLRTLDGEPSRADAMGRQARERASSRYRWDAVADGYASLFRRIVQSRRNHKRAGAPDLSEVYRPDDF